MASQRRPFIVMLTISAIAFVAIVVIDLLTPIPPTERLRALREEFRENTRDRVVEMRALVTTIETSPDSNRLRDLERHFHGLAGLGGTYGYDSVTALSREGEDLCEEAADAPATVDTRRLSEILSSVLVAIEMA